MKRTRADKAPRATLFGTGLIALDSIVVDHDYDSARHRAGGTCANVLSVVSHLGARARIFGSVGDDAAGTIVLSDLAESRLDCSGIIVDPDYETPTIVESILYPRKNGSHPGRPKHKFLFMCPSCGRRLARFKSSHNAIAPSLYEDISGIDVFFFDRATTGALRAAAFASSRGALVVFEPSKSLARERLLAAMNQSDVVKYSAQVVRRPVDTEIFQSGSRTRLLIETNGAKGARFRLRVSSSNVTTWTSLPSYPAAFVVDTAGAGDWFTAGMLYRFLLGKRSTRWRQDNVRDALSFAQALAAASISQVGPRGLSEVASRRTILGIVDAALAKGELNVKPCAVGGKRADVVAQSNACQVCLGPRLLDGNPHGMVAGTHVAATRMAKQ